MKKLGKELMDSLSNVHNKKIATLLQELKSTNRGINEGEAAKRLQVYGRNHLPAKAPPTLLQIFFYQFLNPLIYILGIAAFISIALGDHSDAFFIILVVIVNAVIGTFQEYSAEKSAQALREMAASKCMVERAGELFEVDAELLVPGDIVLLESGRKVPADLRLIDSHSLEIDESLLTGESEPVLKSHGDLLAPETVLADRKNMAFTGSLVTKGRGRGLVVATSFKTELGKIAASMTHGKDSKPPLLIRMEKFTKKIALFLVLIISGMAIYLLVKGQSWHEVLIFSVAIAVSAIPEGLPVALTVALSIASGRMAKRKVIVRKLPAVEALGSCSYIATDKTGTLTVNQLTVCKVVLPRLAPMDVSGTGLYPEGDIATLEEVDIAKQKELLEPLLITGVLCNESQLLHKNGDWVGYGDAVDLALLVLAEKGCLKPTEIRGQYKLEKEIPFEAENQYAATLHHYKDQSMISIKGALEKILPMCDKMLSSQGEILLDSESIIRQADKLAESGFRVLTLAQKYKASPDLEIDQQLNGLTFLGLVGMMDPLRPEAAEAVQACHRAGIEVAMVTGDHPKTALAISKQLNLAQEMAQVVTGPQLKSLPTEQKGIHIEKARVFARVEPQQKLEIVRYLINRGQFVAVTGDGANDAPALKTANVGVAMGKSGTDIAKETSDLIITDDRFASIVSGIEEGRIAYSNVRKVVYLLISTGAAEILMFSLALLFSTPMPLTPVQILWLNLVTNGIQHIGLAFEPGEGDELSRKPRRPDEPVFDRLMLERIAISAIVMGGISFIYFYQLIQSGINDFSARNLTLLLMVLFENIMVGNCRSETKSAFSISLLSNRILLYGTLGAQLIHIASLYVPSVQTVLGTESVTLLEWLKLLFLAISILLVMEVYKWVLRRRKSTK